MKDSKDIILYGAQRCHKTVYYQKQLTAFGVSFVFKDIEESEEDAEELRELYKSKKLNFPTILLGAKRLRNPKEADLKKWLEKLQSNLKDTN